jgi:peptidoglycan/LPS O-acetylase OafA/YrhL
LLATASRLRRRGPALVGSPQGDRLFVLGRRPVLDGVRAVGILAVMAYHLRSDYFPGGYLGVQMFFVLSGFLITALLVAEYSSGGTIRLGAFYVRRALRLLPALLVMLAAVVIYAVVTYAHPGRILQEAFATLAYGNNWYRAFWHVPSTLLSHTWSLSVEEQFYFTWPLLLLLALRRSARLAFGLAAAATIACAIWRVYSWESGAPLVRIYNGFDTRADALLIGCSLALALHLGYAQRAASFLRFLFYPALLFVLVCFEWLRMSSPALYLFGLFFFSLAVAVGLYNLVCRDTWLGAMLGSRPAVFVGLISYSLYLWHYPVLIGLERYRVSHAHVLAVLLSFAFAIGSYYLVEKPCLRLKQRFSRRIPPPDQAHLLHADLELGILTARSATAARAADDRDGSR